MHIMYVDEAGVADLTHPSTYFITTGVIFHTDDLYSMKNQIQKYKDDYFIGTLENAEIHIHKIWQSKSEFTGMLPPAKISLLDPLYNLISNLPCTVIAVLIDKKKFTDRHSDPDQIHQYAYMILTERYDYFLRDNDSKGLIRIDRTSSPQELKLNCRDTNTLESINDIRKNGTYYHSPAIDIIEEPQFLHSHHRKGLQIADAVCYCVGRKSNGYKDFDKYWDLIYPKLRQSRYGQVGGFGFIIYPK